MARFDVVHASDLHFGAEPNRLTSPLEDPLGWADVIARDGRQNAGGRRRFFRWRHPASHDEEVFERFADRITQIEASDGIDLVVLSGDIATTGHTNDLAAAVDALTAPFATAARPYLSPDGRPTLGARVGEIIVIPGNHDRFRPNTLLPGNQNFEASFGQFWRAQGSTTGRVSAKILAEIGIQQRPTGEKLAVVCADFSLRSWFHQHGALCYVGQGRVYGDVLYDLVRKTNSLLASEPRPAILWVVHFPPSWEACANNMKLIGERHLVAAAHRLGVPIILSGHQHKHRIYRLSMKRQQARARRPLMIVAGTAAQRQRTGSHSFVHLKLETKHGRVSNGVANIYERDDVSGNFSLVAKRKLWLYG